jgi:hypothetical protein
VAAAITRAILASVVLIAAVVWIPMRRGWEALDPFLLCGFALLGAVYAGPAAIQSGFRRAWAIGVGLSMAVVAATIVSVNQVVRPPNVLLPRTGTILKLAVLAVSAPALLAAIGASVASRHGKLAAGIAVRLAMLLVGLAWLMLPALDVLDRLAWFMPPMAVASAVYMPRAR